MCSFSQAPSLHKERARFLCRRPTTAPTAQHFSSVHRVKSLTVFAERACTVLGSMPPSLPAFAERAFAVDLYPLPLHVWRQPTSESTPAGHRQVLSSSSCLPNLLRLFQTLYRREPADAFFTLQTGTCLCTFSHAHAGNTYKNWSFACVFATSA